MNVALPSVPEVLKARTAKAAQGKWVPGCGGTEEPFISKSGKRLLYCFQPSTGRHAYLDCDSDIILSNEEANAAMGVW